LRDSLEAISNH